ncbi:ribbon-helix-helix domain-containing protein [Christensenellaceae bacterium OttesenSCG-928-M15]|nr:ribbon-helix-helix domain-containing protein [Christensenellaceae bacterium OttesenSCG-928-M15]
MEDKLEIPYKGKGRGEDGYKYTSVRLKDETIEALDAIAAKSNRSRNEIITIMLEYCIGHAVVTFDKEEEK